MGWADGPWALVMGPAEVIHRSSTGAQNRREIAEGSAGPDGPGAFLMGGRFAAPDTLGPADARDPGGGPDAYQGPLGGTLSEDELIAAYGGWPPEASDDDGW